MAQSLLAFSRGLAEAVRRAGAFTVMVAGGRQRPASGILTREDRVLTASHSVERDQAITVTLPDGASITATLAGRDPMHDLALLRLGSPAAHAALAQAGETPAVGELALSIARTSFDGINATLGIVNAVGEQLPFWRGSTVRRYFQTDAARYAGFSGGPAVDVEGRLLGLNVFGHRFGTALCIPASLMAEIALQLEEHGSSGRGWLGIRSQSVELPGWARPYAEAGQQTGLLLMSVEEGSPAEKAGMLMGDVLVGFAGSRVDSHQQLIGLLGAGSVGKDLPADVLRAGGVAHLTVAVTPAP
jgi:S1-C subfamily serine protease